MNDACANINARPSKVLPPRHAPSQESTWRLPEETPSPPSSSSSLEYQSKTKHSNDFFSCIIDKFQDFLDFDKKKKNVIGKEVGNADTVPTKDNTAAARPHPPTTNRALPTNQQHNDKSNTPSIDDEIPLTISVDLPKPLLRRNSGKVNLVEAEEEEDDDNLSSVSSNDFSLQSSAGDDDSDDWDDTSSCSWGLFARPPAAIETNGEKSHLPAICYIQALRQFDQESDEGTFQDDFWSHPLFEITVPGCCPSGPLEGNQTLEMLQSCIESGEGSHWVYAVDLWPGKAGNGFSFLPVHQILPHLSFLLKWTAGAAKKTTCADSVQSPARFLSEVPTRWILYPIMEEGEA